MHKFLEAARVAIKNHEYDDKVSYRLAALLVRGGKIVSIGYNSSTTNSFVEHYTDSVLGSGRGYLISTHAEMSAVLQVRSKIDLTGSKIYVARLKADDSFGLAKPCIICRKILYSYGIKRAIYSIEENNYGVLKIVEPETTFNDRDGKSYRY